MEVLTTSAVVHINAPMATAVELLLQHGFPKGIVSALREDGVTDLLDHQVEAAIRFDLLGSEDLLVSLPTSCGKTLIGELAGVGAALLGKRAVFSVPLKALAREKFEAFQKRYAGYGLRVRLATGEFSAHIESLHRGDFDIAVMIHEKFKHTLLRDPGFLQGIQVAVLDELQGVEDPSRGPNLEFLLALLKRRNVRRVGLAGVLAPDDPLVEDFGNRVLTAHRRPVDLREGIVLTDEDLVDAALRDYGLERPPIEGPGLISVFRSHNTGLVEAESLSVSESGEGEGWGLLNLALGLAEAEESVLVFLPSRRDAETAALLLAENSPFRTTLDFPGEAGEVESEKLLACLQKGVAFHHSDCSPKNRARVEEAFRNSQVKILCCTSTLAMGVNLPATNVLIHPFVWNKNGDSGELSILREAVVRNMAGRAGRLGLAENHGRALILAATQREWDLYRSRYWGHIIPRLQPDLIKRELGPHLLAGIAVGHDTPESLADLMSCTLSALAGQGSLDGVQRKVREGLNDALNFRFIEGDGSYRKDGVGSNHLELRPLGRVVALRGISFETGREFAEWVDRVQGHNPTPLACLLRVCSTSEARSWNWPRDRNPESRARWVNRVREHLSWEDLQSFGNHWQEKEAVSRRFEDAAKMAWALREWAEGEPFAAIRDSTAGVASGSMCAAGEGARWLLETLSDVWQVRGHSKEGSESIRLLAHCVGSGLPEWALAWEIVPSEILDRDEKLTFAKELPNPSDLLEAGSGNLENLASPLQVARVKSFLEKVFRKNGMGEKSQEKGRGSEVPQILLDANLVETGNSFQLATWKQNVRLGIRGCELLLRLVRERKTGRDGGWVPKENLGIEPENLSQRISDLRSRLGPPPPGMRTWVESDRRGHYRLTCEGTRVSWNPEKTPAEVERLMG